MGHYQTRNQLFMTETQPMADEILLGLNQTTTRNIGNAPKRFGVNTCEKRIIIGLQNLMYEIPPKRDERNHEEQLITKDTLVQVVRDQFEIQMTQL